jgi:hypothetical protein
MESVCVVMRFFMAENEGNMRNMLTYMYESIVAEFLELP